MSHTLIIGGTGMLRDVSIRMTFRYDVVSVVARSEARLNRLALHPEAGPGRVNPISVDYRQSSRLASAMEEATDRFGPVSQVISWIHSTAPNASEVIADVVCVHPDEKEVIRWFDVLGSASAGPVRLTDYATGLRSRRRILYRSIVLGFVVEDGRSRWLTNREIGSGVIKAVENDIESSVIGQVRPWSMRP